MNKITENCDFKKIIKDSPHNEEYFIKLYYDVYELYKKEVIPEEIKKYIIISFLQDLRYKKKIEYNSLDC